MLNAAIIGLGNWGQVLVNAVQGRSDQIRFVAAATGRPERAADFAARQRLDLLPDLAAVLARRDVQAVVLATPHSLHAAQIAAVAATGRHVFCEKPLTLTLADTRAALAATQAAGVILAPGHNRRFLPAYRKLQDLVGTGALGAVRQMIGNFSWGTSVYRPDSWRNLGSESPAGGMTGLGIHVVDAMVGLGLRGASLRVVAKGAPGARAHTLTALIEGRGDEVAVLTTMGGPGKVWRLEVFGAEGHAAMDGETRLSFARAGEPVQTWDFGAFDMERAELEAFARAIAGGAPWPVTPDQAEEGIALFEAICRGAEVPGGLIPL